ncbi:unnamed protein product [Linum tenue]|uniref:Uncharacterized protein n=1 Tax=Linum tenue TaxID=586396 RepID=A0AAV0JX53_9ROSI|nr:unnamed protein product [Linum tenue]
MSMQQGRGRESMQGRGSRGEGESRCRGGSSSGRTGEGDCRGQKRRERGAEATMATGNGALLAAMATVRKRWGDGELGFCLASWGDG